MGCASSAGVKDTSAPTRRNENFDPTNTNSNHSSFDHQTPDERAVSILTLKSGRLNIPGETTQYTPLNTKRYNETNGAEPGGNGAVKAIPKRLRDDVTRFSSLSVPTSPLMTRIREKQEAMDGRASALGIAGEGSGEDPQVILNKALRELSRSLSASHGSIFHIDDDGTGPTEDVHPGSPPLINNNTVIINIGSGYCKGGFTQDDTPSVVMPTVVGRPKSNDALPGISMDTMFVGNDAKLRREALVLTHPVKRGVVDNWEEWTAIVRHVITMELKVELEEACVVMPTSPMTTRENREMIVEIMFKNLQVSKLYLGSSAPMALHAFSMTSSLLITIGHDVTSCVPVIQGNVCSDAVRVLPLGGADITEQLTTLIRRKDTTDLNRDNDDDIAKAMMERLCYVAQGSNDDTEVKQRSRRTYSLPNGSDVKLDKERFLAPEILFKPSLRNERSRDKGLHHVCVESIQACPDDVADDLYSNVVIVGGTSLLPGLSERLKNELCHILPDKKNLINIHSLPKRQYATWRGASRMTSLSTSRHRWIHMSEFKEFGPSIVHRKYV